MPSVITLQQAQEQLTAWLAADRACALGQSYAIGRYTLTRADADKIQRKITYWTAIVSQLSRRANRRGIAHRLAIPRDW